MGNYWLTVFRNAWRAYFARIRQGARQAIVFMLQTVTLFGILYFVPWFGELRDESRLAAASVGSVGIVALLGWVWDFVRTPAEMHSAQEAMLSDARRALLLEEQSDAVRDEMLSLCREGRSLLDQTDFACHIADWKGRALVVLRQHYAVNFVYEFENEAFWQNPPQGDYSRMKGLVQMLETTALSWGSKAEQAQQSFRPRL